MIIMLIKSNNSYKFKKNKLINPKKFMVDMLNITSRIMEITNFIFITLLMLLIITFKIVKIAKNNKPAIFKNIPNFNK
jgi:hypothetical protein